MENVQHDLDLLGLKPQKFLKGELLSNRAFIVTSDYLNERAKDGEGVMFDLIARNREIEDVANAAEEIIKIIEGQRFTIAESLLFLKHLEGMILASPMKY